MSGGKEIGFLYEQQTAIEDRIPVCLSGTSIRRAHGCGVGFHTPVHGIATLLNTCLMMSSLDMACASAS